MALAIWVCGPRCILCTLRKSFAILFVPHHLLKSESFQTDPTVVHIQALVKTGGYQHVFQ
jgi:hypothetical protein